MRALHRVFMDYSTGKLSFIFMAALLLACLGAWAVAARYRVVMRHLMSAPVAARAVVAVAAPTPAREPLAPPAPVTLADNRREATRLTLLLVGLSCLIAVSSASLWYALAFKGEAFAPKRVAVIALLHLWPVVPALALMWRWSALRALAVLALWCASCFAVMLWRSIEPRPFQTLLALAAEIGPGLLVVALLCSGDAMRAVGPWLLLPFVGLAWASMAGLDLLGMLVAQPSRFTFWLVSWLPVGLAMPLFALLPWWLAWWPLRRLGRALGRAYVRKQLSELMVLFTTVWAIALLIEALSIGSRVGLAGAALLLPLAWIPLVIRFNARWRHRAGRAPTLLVLRVFQRDAQIQSLFDHVVERWRLSGNTVLIAGTDLVDRTLDADDILTFLDGALSRRFIQTSADVVPRLAAFDLGPDADGRFRVNECYCHDTSWQDALNALVQRSDVVLMDLRSFQAHNAGCRYELGTLARAPRLARVVVLTDSQTDRTVAQASIAGAPAGRFLWIDTSTIDAAKRHEVLASLFVP
ncbi:MAG: hypothetical protein ABI887_04570 [Burkholderiales bacterium]